MKLSTQLLCGLGIVTIAALLFANIAIKKSYDKADKDDFLYWGYGKILEQPFKHIKIEGGNITRIAFEQSEKPSVRLLKQWPGYVNGSVKAFVNADTLFIKFPNLDTTYNAKMKDWVKHTTLIRIFAPGLVSVEGTDTDFDLLNLRQKSLFIRLLGNSSMEVETGLCEMDSLSIFESGTSNLSFETAPGTKANSVIHVRSVDINLNGTSKLDIGLTRVSSLKTSIADSALITHSGFIARKIIK